MRKVLKVTLWIIGSILFLVLLAIIIIITPPGKNFVRKQAVSFLNNKLKTEVQIGELDYELPKMIVLRDVLFLDQKRDTLLAGKELKVDINMLKLLKNTVDVQEVRLNGIYSHLYRIAPDTNFNFAYIIDAFASQTPVDTTKIQAPDTSAAMTFHLAKLVIDNVRFKMDDYTGGSRMDYAIDKMRLTMEALEPSTMTYKVDKLLVDGFRAVMITDTSYLPPTPEDTSTAPLVLNIGANELDLKNVSFAQKDFVGRSFMDFKVGSLLAHPGKMDITHQDIAIKDIKLQNTQINMLLGKVAADKAKEIADTAVQTNPDTATKWRVTVGDVNLNNIGFAMNNENEPRVKQGIDYSHLDLTGLVLDAKDINYTTDTIAGIIQHFTVKEQSGLYVQELKTNFAYYPEGAFLRDFYLQTDKTILQDFVQVKYPSLEALTTHPELVQVKLNLENSVIGMKDVLLFAPQLEQQDFFRKNKFGQLQLAARVEGKMDALDIGQFYLSGLGNTEVNISGAVYGMPDPNKISYNLNVAKLQSSRRDLETLLPPATLKSFRLPDRFGLAGTLSGTTVAYKPNLIFMSTDGNANIRGLVDMSRGTGRERYDISLKTQALNVGRMLRMDTVLGTITADLAAQGTGFDPKTLNAKAKGTIHSAVYQKYNYHDIAFSGSMAQQKANFDLKANDPNLRLALNGNANLSGKYPSVYADAIIDSVDLQALHFNPTELRLRGELHADFPELNPDYPQGELVIDNPVITTNGTRYALDTFYLKSHPSADSGNNIVLFAQMLSAHVWGHTPLTKIGNIIQYQIDRHYVFDDSTMNAQKKFGAKYDLPADYDLKGTARIENHPLITGFVPELKELDTVRIDFGVTPQRLFLNADAPEIQYADMHIDGVRVRVNGTDSALTYAANVKHFQQNSIDLYYAKVFGDLRTNLVNANVSVSDVDSVPRFGLGASLQRNEDAQIVQLQPGLLLNYKTWQVTPQNQIVFGPPGFYIQNFAIRNGNESISVNSQSPTFNAPLTADISNFSLSNITEIISKDTLLANGILGGTVNVQQISPNPELTTNLLVSNLAMFGDTIGNVNIDVKTAPQNAFDAKVGITGQGNNVQLSGLYYTQPVNGNNFDMNLILNPLNVASIEGATMNAIENTSGGINGNLSIKGTASAPVINGQLQTNQLQTTVSALGAPFFMPSEVIRFNGQSIVFDKFSIRDSAGHAAVIDGRILTQDFANMKLAMNIKANEWQAMNSTPADNKTFNGQLFFSTDLDITGPVAAPNVDGSVSILKGTDINATIPQSEPGIQDRKGVVEFVDYSLPGGQNVLLPKNPDSANDVATRVPKGSDINVNLNLDEEAQFTVVIDEGSGDFVKVRGKTTLNTSVSPNGTLGLAGVFEIVDGAYQLNYNFVRRLFRIEKGSTITFAGDPTDAQLDITAVYEANIPPYDLVSRQVQDPAELVYYKQKLPFEVQLKIKGQMLQPEIAFDVVLPTDKNYRVSSEVVDVVQAKLNQIRTDKSELNKQVFAVIILNHFVGENPFQNGAGGGGAEAIARQSASRFISEQLNKFAGGLVKGLDLQLGVESSEDYTTGEKRNRTDLNIGASKRLLNDRLTISVGNNFQLEGPRSNSNQNTALIPGNIAVDYDLTADRRYKVRFFRRNEDQGGQAGFVSATGVSFILQVDYNKFRQIFMSKKKMLKKREEERKKQDEGEDSDQSTSAIIDNRELKIAKRK